MGEVLSDGLILPALLLAIAAFVVPRLIARLLPRGDAFDGECVSCRR